MENQQEDNRQNKSFTEDHYSNEKPVKDNRSKPLQLIVFAFITAGLFLLTIYMYLTNLSQNNQLQVVPEEKVVTNTETESIPSIEEVTEQKISDLGNGQYVNVAADEEIGIYLTHLETDQTLYQRTEGFCQDECLEQWVPYSTSSEFTTDRLRSVLVNEEYNLHYVLLDDKMLFTYYGDSSPGDTNGIGVEKVWDIARP